MAAVVVEAGVGVVGVAEAVGGGVGVAEAVVEEAEVVATRGRPEKATRGRPSLQGPMCLSPPAVSFSYACLNWIGRRVK